MRVLAIFLSLWLVAGPCYAGIFNRAESFKQFINNADLKAGTYYDLSDDRWQTYYSLSLFTGHLLETPVWSLDAGYAHQNTVLLSGLFHLEAFKLLSLDLRIGTIRPKVGAGWGYDFGQRDWSYGFCTFGFSMEF